MKALIVVALLAGCTYAPPARYQAAPAIWAPMPAPAYEPILMWVPPVQPVAPICNSRPNIWGGMQGTCY